MSWFALGSVIYWRKGRDQTGKPISKTKDLGLHFLAYMYSQRLKLHMLRDQISNALDVPARGWTGSSYYYMHMFLLHMYLCNVT